ncbi:chorismate mutase [Streptomyces sp. NBC_01565]|uniref:chorismate mutase n=1 Tax=Streptomyces sp. NBC_01565 TaxID=2975881 RepID=UPI0022522C85|nr:chorismate mutase [Streptomyces sp. NBC_01565]MCX4546207.1 chorismate mutase [Streptomyces sp. NBC_01565]
MTGNSPTHTEGTRTTMHDAIEGDRREIDGLDARIIELLGQRARVSARIQSNRISTGGPRTVLAREAEVLGRYQDGLGATGTPIAMNVLKLCRGVSPATDSALTTAE